MTTPESGQTASGAHHDFASVDELAPYALMDGVRARAVHGERITFAVMDLAPSIGLPEHRHPSEQLGMVVQGEFTFTVGGETRVRRPGDMWVIPPDVPHTVEATGSEGCTVIETFSPPRAEWADVPREQPAPGAWPPR